MYFIMQNNRSLKEAFDFIWFSFFLFFNSHTIYGATHFVITWFAADIIGGDRSQVYQHKTH